MAWTSSPRSREWRCGSLYGQISCTTEAKAVQRRPVREASTNGEAKEGRVVRGVGHTDRGAGAISRVSDRVMPAMRAVRRNGVVVQRPFPRRAVEIPDAVHVG